MKTVLFLIPSLGGGGAEKVLVNLVNSLDTGKYDITVQTLFDVGINKQYLKKHIHYRSCFKKTIKGNIRIFKLFSPEFLYKKLINERYDIVISFLEGSTSRIIGGCPYKDTKLISWVHTLQFTKNNAAYPFRTVEEAEQSSKKMDRIICVAEMVKEDFLTIFPMIECCEVLYNVNETEDIIQLGQERIKPFPKNTINIVSVGRLIPEKGYDRLIRVHKRMIDEGINNNVFILGEGDERHTLLKIIQEEHVTNSIHLLGFQRNPYPYVKNANLFVCSSRREGFSTAVTEALILGTPVVSTNVSGSYELLGKNNEYGIVTKNNEEGLYNGLKTMMTPEVLRHYQAKAIERGQFFSKERAVKAVEEMLDSL